MTVSKRKVAGFRRSEAKSSFNFEHQKK